MEFKIKELYKAEEKTSKLFNVFFLRGILLEYKTTNEQVFATASGKLIEILKNFSAGDIVEATLKVTSKGKKDKWYHDVRLINIKLIGQ